MPDNDLSRRAKDHLPTVLLTLLSIVQALALELMWSHLREQPSLYEWSLIAVIGWTQIAATLFGILLIWLTYASVVMRFRWVPSTADTVFPFLVGILEFVLIGCLGPEMLGPWFIVLGLVFAVMAWVSQKMYQRARQDPENDAYFATMAPATLRDHYATIANVLGFVLIGLYLWLSSNQGVPALLAMLAALGALGVQLRLSDYYWKLSLAAPSHKSDPG